MRLRACALAACFAVALPSLAVALPSLAVALPSLAVALPSLADAQASGAQADAMYFPAARVQTEADEYTRYELLEPATA
ncbi:MAG: hypothetical protein ACYDBZ_14525, partial [Steroidobacteraceae bacterium]